MKAKQANDVCFSTMNGGHSRLNFDGKERTKLDWEEARSALDFDVIKTPMFRQLSNGETRQIDGLFCLTKSTDESIIPSRGVSATFEPVHHHEVFDWVRKEIVPKVPEIELETCGTVYGGSTSIMTFKVGDLFSIKGDKSPQETRLFITNPTNGGGSLVMGFTTVRLWCENQIRAAKREARKDGFVIRHSKGCREVIGFAVNDIAAQLSATKEMLARCERLAEIGVDRAAFERCLDAVYPLHKLDPESKAFARMKAARELVLAEFESGKTAEQMTEKTGWTAFNSFTYPIFNPERPKKQIDMADIQVRGMNGTKADRVGDIFEKVERALVYAA